jgi:hypothetical protein
MGEWMHIFLTAALAGGERSASRPGRFTRGERDYGIHWIGRWVDHRAGLDVEKRKFFILPTLELESLIDLLLLRNVQVIITRQRTINACRIKRSPTVVQSLGCLAPTLCHSDALRKYVTV